MTTPAMIEVGLRQALADAARGGVRFPRDLQGFPGTVHGGAVAALFYCAAAPLPPVYLRMDLRRGVPTETTVRLRTGSGGREARLALMEDAERPLAEATLSGDGVPAVDPGSLLDAWRAGPRPEGEIPGTATCLACGSANPLGLQVRFRLNARLLWREYTPRDAYRGADGATHPALATIMLDELGWWLGALHQGECGVTTEVAVALFRPLPFAPLLVVGDRAAVRPDDDPRARYSRASGYILTPGGDLLAWGEVRFAGSRAYTRRLLRPFLETTEPETLYRLFPGARTLGSRRSEQEG